VPILNFPIDMKLIPKMGCAKEFEL